MKTPWTYKALLFTMALTTWASSSTQPALTDEPTTSTTPQILRTRELGSRALKHAGAVKQLVFAPDGKSLISAGGNAIKIWDSATGKLVRTLPSKRTVGAFALSPDGHLLVAADDREHTLWNVDEGTIVGSFPAQKKDGAALTWSPDGKSVAVGCDDGRVRLLAADTFTETRTFTPETDGKNAGRSQALWFDASGETLYSVDLMVGLVAWQLADGKQVLALKRSGFHKAGAMATGNQPVFALANGYGVELWDQGCKERLGRFDLPHPGWTCTVGDERYENVRAFRSSAVAMSLGGELLFAGGEGEPIIHGWETKTGKRILSLYGHAKTNQQDEIKTLALSPNGNLLASGGADGTVRLWNTQSGLPQVRVPGQSGGVRDVALAPDGKLAAAAAGDGTIALWDVEAGQLIRVLRRHGSPVRALAFSTDGTQLVSAAWNGSVNLWNVATGQLVSQRQLKERSFVGDVAWLAGGDQFVVAGDKKPGPQVFDVSAANPAQEWAGASADTQEVAISPAGRYAATGGYRAAVIWDVNQGKALYTIERAPDKESGYHPESVSIAPDGKRLLVGAGNWLQLHALATGKLLRVFDSEVHKRCAGTVRFLPDNKHFAAIDSRGSKKGVAIFSVTDGALVTTQPTATTPRSLAVSADGKRVICGHSDSMLTVFDLK